MTDWDAIVAREGGSVWRTLWKMLGHRADVEDCFQETFVSALRVAERENVTNWTAMLCRLATARALDRLRHRYRRKRVGEHVAGTAASIDQLVAVEAGPRETAIATELSTQLRAAFAELPEKHAEVFSLFAVQGWSQRDIADRLGMTENAVSVTVHRARARLKQTLEGGSTT